MHSTGVADLISSGELRRPLSYCHPAPPAVYLLCNKLFKTKLHERAMFSVNWWVDHGILSKPCQVAVVYIDADFWAEQLITACTSLCTSRTGGSIPCTSIVNIMALVNIANAHTSVSTSHRFLTSYKYRLHNSSHKQVLRSKLENRISIVDQGNHSPKGQS